MPCTAFPSTSSSTQFCTNDALSISPKLSTFSPSPSTCQVRSCHRPSSTTELHHHVTIHPPTTANLHHCNIQLCHCARPHWSRHPSRSRAPTLHRLVLFRHFPLPILRLPCRSRFPVPSSKQLTSPPPR